MKWGLALLLVATPAAAQQAYAPPLVYQRWFDEVLVCTGLVRPKVTYEHIRFMAVPNESFMAEGRGHRIGYAYPETQTIFVIADSAQNERVIKHEMLHLMLGKPGHGPMFHVCGLQPQDEMPWPTDTLP